MSGKVLKFVELSNRAWKKPTVLVSGPPGRHFPKGEMSKKGTWLMLDAGCL
jgi:hypothetical protein